MSTSIETYSGALVDLAKPDPKDITVEDIAWHLSRTPRFCGATLSENAYSVAQHSVLVLNRVRQMLPEAPTTILFCALLHDAHEAYMGDITAPMGRLLDLSQPIRRLKDRLQVAIYSSLTSDMVPRGKKFAAYIGPEIKEADEWAQVLEAYHLIHSKGRSWANWDLLQESEMYRNFLVWDSQKANGHFLSHYNELVERVQST